MASTERPSGPDPALALAGCGSGAGVNAPTIGGARIYSLTGFRPAGPILPGRPTTISFTIQTPSGDPLTAYKQCCEPHSGVDLIIVRSDNSHVQYEDTDIDPYGRISQPVVFPAPGRYRIVIDAYPKQTSPTAPFNFQLFKWVTVRGNSSPQPIPSYNPTQTVDWFRFQIQPHPRGSLDYFHTHVCGAGSSNCFSALGGVKVTGRSSAPGTLKVGVLLPLPGTWRMFLLTYMHGHVLTVPYTLTVA